MKRILLSFIVAGSTALGLVLTKYLSHPKNQMSDLGLANVEALANSEGGGFQYPNGAAIITDCNVAIGTTIFGLHQRCKVTVVICQGGGTGCNSRICPVHG